MRERKNWKKAIILLSAWALCVSMTGCSSGENVRTELRETEAKTRQDQTETFQWYINYSWFTTDWGENAVSNEITEKTGVDIEFVTPTGDGNEQLKALIETDQLPDLITLGWWEEPVSLMIDQGQVYALNELADQYDPYFWKVADPIACQWYTQEDGNVYGYPNDFYTPEDYEQYDDLYANITCLVRKDIYEAIGSPDMTTTEGFYQAIVKAAEMFPQVDGKDLIPLGVHEFTEYGCDSFGKFLQNLLAIPYEENGKLYDRYMDEEYLRWLKMFRKLGAEGYLAQDIFVDKRQQMEEKILDGRYFCMIYQWTDMESQQKVLYEQDPESSYIAVDGPKNSNGSDYQLPGTGIAGWTLTFISKNCKNPEKAIKFLSYLMSEEGQKTLYLGVEGVTYDMKEGQPVLKPEVVALMDTDRDAYNRKYGADGSYWMIKDTRIQKQWHLAGGEENDACQQMKEWTQPYVIDASQYDRLLKEDVPETEIDHRIKSAWGRMLPKLLTAESNQTFDQYIQEFKEERARMGYDQLMEAENQQLLENKEKLGILED